MSEAAASQPAAAEATTTTSATYQHETDQLEPTSARASKEGPLEPSNLTEVQAGDVDTHSSSTRSQAGTTTGGDEVLERARELMVVSPRISFLARGNFLREACYSVGISAVM